MAKNVEWAGNKAAHKLLKEMQNQFGAGTVMMASEMPKYPPITSGSLSLDCAVGIGGLPSDRVIEICGEEQTGKTTLALLAMQQFLAAQPDRGALILDTEHKMDPHWLAQLVGEQVLDEKVLYVQPDHIEQATNIYKMALQSGTVCFALLDSIGGSPTVRRNDDATVASYGGNAMGVGEFGRAAASHSAKYRALTIGVNQIREDMSGYNRLKVPGGHAWVHAVALRLQLKKITKSKVFEKINGEEVQVGSEIACKVVKSSVSAPGRTATWWFYSVPTAKYGFGIDTLDEVVRLGILTGVIERRGGWYYHSRLPLDKGEAKILGRDRLMEYIRSDIQLQRDFSADITARLQDHVSMVAPMSDPEAEIPDVSTLIPFPDDPKDMSEAQLDYVVKGLVAND